MNPVWNSFLFWHVSMSNLMVLRWWILVLADLMGAVGTYATSFPTIAKAVDGRSDDHIVFTIQETK